jgi:hypothetical protein
LPAVENVDEKFLNTDNFNVGSISENDHENELKLDNITVGNNNIDES